MKPISIEQKRCERILKLLDSYISRELMLETNHEVLQHLEACRSCSAELENKTRTKALLRRAVTGEAPPADLRARLQARLRDGLAEQRHPKQVWQGWAMAVAAALVLMVGGYALMHNRLGLDSPETEQARLSEISEQAMQILRIGLGDHVRCAVDHGFAERLLSEEKMSELLQGYSGLADELKLNAPTGYRLTAAHNCRVDDRSFAHLILRKPEGFVSVILTPKQGESYPAEGSGTIESLGVELHQAQLDGFQVAGFETGRHLGFFISSLGAQENLAVAAKLAPALRNGLARVEI